VIEEFLQPRHRHYQVDKDPFPPHLCHLTIRAWEAVQHALDGNETATQVIFDEINSALEEVDRMSFPGEEVAQRRLLALEAERNDLRDSLAKRETGLPRSERISRRRRKSTCSCKRVGMRSPGSRRSLKGS